jgi:uncharacterized membrane protein YphA (DoxX/SURF4 family)
MQGPENATMLLGRVLLSLLFLIGGTIKLLGPAATQAMFVKQGLPMVEAAWVLAVVVEVGGGWRCCSACSLDRLGLSWRCGASQLR